LAWAISARYADPWCGLPVTRVVPCSVRRVWRRGDDVNDDNRVEDVDVNGDVDEYMCEFEFY
jgi:hypothetical protein